MKKMLIVAMCFLLTGVFFLNLNAVSAEQEVEEAALDVVSAFDVAPENLIGRWQANFTGSKYVYGSIGKKPVSFSEIVYINVTEAEVINDPMTDASMIFATGLAYSDQAQQNNVGDIMMQRYIVQGFGNGRTTINIYKDVGDDLCYYRSTVFFVPATVGKKASPDSMVGSVERLFTAFDPATDTNTIIKEVSWGMATFMKY